MALVAQGPWRRPLLRRKASFTSLPVPAWRALTQLGGRQDLQDLGDVPPRRGGDAPAVRGEQRQQLPDGLGLDYAVCGALRGAHALE
jgi:hypothetical protein